MTRKAHLVGLTYAGRHFALPECANDARGWAEQLTNRRNAFDCRVLVDSTVSWQQMRDDALAHLRGADVAVLLHSMHGYLRRRDGRGNESGIWPGEPVPHATVMRELIAPLCAQCGTVIYVLDACYSGGAKMTRGVVTADAAAEAAEAPAIKCVTLDERITAVDADPGDIVTVDVPGNRLQNYAVFAACGRKQQAFGAFRGRFGSRFGMNTQEHSLHTYNLVGALHACTWLSLKLAFQYMTWRNRAACDAFAPYAWWRGKGWTIPDCNARIGKNVPDDILRAT